MPTAVELSVAIPTYNHPQDLKRLLDTIVPEMRPGAEVVIRDDSPDSQTAELVEGYKDKLPIRYFHGEKIGLDGAVIFLTENSAGRYVWWFGDNDEMRPGAIQRVLEVVRKHPDISYINANIQIAGQRAPVYPQAEGFYTPDQMIENFTSAMGFITATIFRREDVLSALQPAKKFIGTAFVNLYISLAAVTAPGRKYFTGRPLVTVHPTPAGQYFYDGFPTFAVHFFKIFQGFKNKLGRRPLKRAMAYNFGNVWRGVLVARARGESTGFGSPAPKIPTLLKLYWSYPEIWIAVPLLLLPRWADRLLYRAYRVFFRYRQLRFFHPDEK